MKNPKNNKWGSHKPHNKPHSKARNKPAKTPQRSNKVKINLYGAHAAAQAWVNPARHIHELYITDKALDGFDSALKKAHDLGLTRPAPQIVDKSALDHSTPPGSVHQGIGLTCQTLEETDIHDIIRAEDPKERSVLIMLDQVTDPHNVGAIIRSACVFGAGGMILQKKHAPELTGVLAKTACGGVEHVPVAYETNLTRSLETLQDAGYWVIGFSEHAEMTLQPLNDHQKIVIIVGAEGDGMRRLLKEKCDLLVSLPTAGPITSLNVSNAAAVALYAVQMK